MFLGGFLSPLGSLIHVCSRQEPRISCTTDRRGMDQPVFQTVRESVEASMPGSAQNRGVQSGRSRTIFSVRGRTMFSSNSMMAGSWSGDRRGREHIIEPNGEHVTSLNRSDSAHVDESGTVSSVRQPRRNRGD